tara:strand:- start:3979 stop:4527 length:549 start_codon:yes stop_codon:yes gene_type:complete
MAKALLITTQDIPKYTAMNGGVDIDKFIQFVSIAQDIHLQNLLGSDLLEKIQLEITNATLSGVYLALNTDYIKQTLIHYSMVEYLPFAAFSISNKGIYKHNSENSQNAEKIEVDFLIAKERDIAEHYATRLVDYLCNNSADFPEYSSNTGADVIPDRNTVFNGWMLDNNIDRDRLDYNNLEL